MQLQQQATSESERKVIEADEVRVGPITIVRTSGDTAGIWIGDGNKRTSIAIFNTPTQQGVGLYAKGFPGACNVCLIVDEDGAGAIQLAKGDEVVYLTFDDVKRIAAERGK